MNGAKNQSADVEETVSDLRIDEQLSLHKKGWMVQTIGLLLLFTIVILSALGMFGNGWLSVVRKSSGHATVEYERYFRHEAVMELKIHSDQKNDLTVSFPSTYIKDFDVRSIVPEPRSNTISQGRVTYSFLADGPSDITFYLVPQKVGLTEAAIGVNNTRFQFSQFIFP